MRFNLVSGLYKKQMCDSEVKRSFIWGLAKSVQNYADYEKSSYCFYLAGHLLFSRKLVGNVLTYKVLNFSLKLNVANRILRQLNSIFSDVLPEIKGEEQSSKKRLLMVFWGNAGEVALFLSCLSNAVLKKYMSSDNVELFALCTRKYHKNMLQFYFPGIKAKVCKPGFIHFLRDNQSVGDWCVRLFFSVGYFRKLDVNFRSGVEKNFFHYMRSHFGISEGFLQLSQPNREQYECALRCVMERFPHLLKQKEKVVIISPYSNSLGNLTEEELNKTVALLKSKGLIPFVNSDDPKSNDFMSYAELYVLSAEVKAVVAIRSGLIDFIAPTGTPMLLFYRTQSNEKKDLFSFESTPYFENKKEILLKDGDDMVKITESWLDSL